MLNFEGARTEEIERFGLVRVDAEGGGDGLPPHGRIVKIERSVAGKRCLGLYDKLSIIASALRYGTTACGG